MSDIKASTIFLLENKFVLQEGIKTEASAVRGVLSTHHKLMTEFRTILKSMAKVGQVICMLYTFTSNNNKEWVLLGRYGN